MPKGIVIKCRHITDSRVYRKLLLIFHQDMVCLTTTYAIEIEPEGFQRDSYCSGKVKVL